MEEDARVDDDVPGEGNPFAAMDPEMAAHPQPLFAALRDTLLRGDVSGAVRRLQHCTLEPGCRARMSANIAALKRPGAVSILQLATSTSFSLGTTLGNARVAFRIGNSLPIVQCVRVRRAGNVLSGLRVELLSVTPPMTGNASCP